MLGRQTTAGGIRPPAGGTRGGLAPGARAGRLDVDATDRAAAPVPLPMRGER
jgi:hypothetical protein